MSSEHDRVQTVNRSQNESNLSQVAVSQVKGFCANGLALPESCELLAGQA
jgi:hypothetical protein